MDNLIARAEMLIQQNRPKEAREILVKLLHSDPNDPEILAMMGRVEMQSGYNQDALRFLNDAISISPDSDYLFYLKALALIELDKFRQADESLREAISINPNEAEYFGLRSTLKTDEKQYEEGLEFADRGLELDAENTLCLNARGRALMKLDRSEESFQTLDGALNEDPNNAFTHANFGWSELEKGDHRKALDHFREALRIDPNMEYAQGGMLEAIKSRYWLYRIFLSYAFWMSNMTARYQWGVIIGFYIGFRIVRSVSNANPELAPILQPVLIILAVIAFSTWITNPISNLFLRLNTYGRHLLDDKEKLSSNLVGLSMLVLIAGFVRYLINDSNTSLAILFLGLGLMVPFSVVFASAKQKYLLPIYSVIMTIVGIGAVYETMQTNELFNTYSTIFILGFVAFQWIANYVLISEDNS